MRVHATVFDMETRDLLRLIKDQGGTVVVSKRTHYKVYSPSGRYVTTMASTPSDGKRSMQNTIADLRRGGISIPRK